MDHSFIEEHNHIFRYVRGTMSVAERSAFEEHFLDCPDCLEQLEVARSMREAIRLAAAELAPSTAAAGGASGISWLQRRFGWRWMPLSATACLAAALLTGGLLYLQLERTRSELGRTQLAYARELDMSRKLLQGPGRNSPLFYTLSQSRGAGLPVRVLQIPRSPRWVMFSIEFDASQFQTYRATLRNQAAQAVWQNDNLQPSSDDSIAIPVLSTYLTPGAYTLTLEGLADSGQHLPISTFSIQLEPQP
jgi:Putative zinc-finger